MNQGKIGLYVLAGIGILYILIVAVLFIKSHDQPFVWFGKIDNKPFADFIAHIAGVATFFAFLFAFLSFHEQSKFIKVQQFESTFFNMLNHFDLLIKSIEIDETNRLETGDTIESKRKKKIGKQALNTLYEDFLTALKSGNISMDELWDEDFKSEDLSCIRWKEMYQANICTLPQYFRYYFTIVKFIMTSNINDKKKYTDILQALMSSHEMGLIFSNLFHNPSITNQYGAIKFKKWLNDREIGLFENIQKESVHDIEEFKKKCSIDFKHI